MKSTGIRRVSDPDPVCPARLDPDPVIIRPDPKPWVYEIIYYSCNNDDKVKTRAQRIWWTNFRCVAYYRMPILCRK